MAETNVYKAIELGENEKVKSLVFGSDNVNLGSLLSFASRVGNGELVTLLLGAGVDVNNNSCLIQAILNEHEDIVKLLLEHDNSQAYTSHGTFLNGNFYPLHVAAETGNINIAQLLLDNGANINQKGGHAGEAAPLSYAALAGNAEMAAFLLENGAQLETYNPNALPSVFSPCASAFVSSALLNAIVSENMDTFKILLAAGVDQNLGFSSFHIAAIQGDSEKIEALSAATALNGEDVNIDDALGAKPIHYAAFLDRDNVIEALIKLGADFNAPLIVKLDDGQVITPLQIAASKGAAHSIEVLSMYGAEPEGLQSLLLMDNVFSSNIENSDMQPIANYLPNDPLSQISQMTTSMLVEGF